MESLKAKIESILFLEGAPISLEKLAKLIGEKKTRIEEALVELRSDYQKRGIRLLSNNDEWQFATSPENATILDSLVKSEFSEELSKAALETLSVIAYKGPLTRSEIEYIRGVNSSFSIRNLMLRGLIERIENPKDARSYLYRISMEFLKYLGLEKREDLPQWESFHASRISMPEEANNENLL